MFIEDSDYLILFFILTFLLSQMQLVLQPHNHRSDLDLETYGLQIKDKMGLIQLILGRWQLWIKIIDWHRNKFIDFYGMNQIQDYFRTFNNSPQSLRHMLSNPEPSSTSSHNPQNRPSKSTRHKNSKKSKQSQTNSSQSHSTHLRYPTEISLMNSDVSLLELNLFKDLPLDLLTLQVQVTEELLALREDKLTLLEEYNKRLGDRFKVERQIAKIKKKNQSSKADSSQNGVDQEALSSQNSPQHTTPATDRHPVIVKNEALIAEYNKLRKYPKRSSDLESMTGSDQDMQVLQIEQIQYKSHQIQQQLQKMEEKFQKINEQRFQTFFPNQKRPTGNKRAQEQFLMLRAQKQALYLNLLRQSSPQDQEASQILYYLVEENRELQEKASNLLHRKKQDSPNSIKNLKEKIARQQEQKSLFFEDLQKFKRQIISVREQNLKMAEMIDQ